MSPRLSLALAALALFATGCGDDDPAPAPSAPEPSTQQTPGDATTAWAPTVPTSPVDEAEVQEVYDDVLDDVATAVDGQAPGLTWSAPTLRTEDFEGTCAVTLERTADGTVPPPGDDTLDLGEVDAAVRGAGFGQLTMADDPGGAVRYLAEGDAGALLELRSKDVTTLAVRVPTTVDSCTE